MLTRLMNIPRKHRNLGFSLTELAIVLGIAGTLLASVWAASSAVYKNNRISKTMQQVTHLATEIKSYYTNREYITASGVANITQTLLDAGVIPPDLGTTTAALQTATEGNLSIYSSGSDPQKHFTIRVSGLRESECRGLAARTSGSNPIAGLVPDATSAIKITNGDGTGGTWYSADSATLSALPAATECKGIWWNFTQH